MINMKKFVSYSLAALAGICFVSGLAVLSLDEDVNKHGL